jgi:L-lysine exporter family protein LysE/ArgO
MSAPLLAPPFFTGFTLGASLIMAIGAQNAFVLRQGLRREHVAAVVAACAALDVLLMAIGVSGLGAVLGDRPRFIQAATVAGAVVLAWYSLSAFRRAFSPHRLSTHSGGAAQPLRTVVAQALSISLLNPHVYLDTVLLVGSVGAQQPGNQRLAFLAGSGLSSLLWFAGLGFAARLLSPLFARPVAWRVLDALVGLTMAWIAFGLAASAWR